MSTAVELWEEFSIGGLSIAQSTATIDARKLESSPQTALPSFVSKLEKVVCLKQVHSSAIHSLSLDTLLEPMSTFRTPLEPADGVVAERKFLVDEGLFLMVRTADCVPLLVASEKRVALLHCGWRGVALGIITQLKAYFSPHEQLIVFVGPSICSRCFEVGIELQQFFPSAFMQKQIGGVARYSVDLQAEICAQLRAGFSDIRFQHHDSCTYHSEHHHSYRKFHSQVDEAGQQSPLNALIVGEETL